MLPIYGECGKRFFVTRKVRQGAGSDFLWDADGHVVTNYHVIQGARSTQVRLDSGEASAATYVGGAPEYDLAVNRLRRKPVNNTNHQIFLSELHTNVVFMNLFMFIGPSNEAPKSALPMKCVKAFPVKIVFVHLLHNRNRLLAY